MSRQWRIYVGAEVPPVGPTPSPCEGESQQLQLLLDTAFARRAALTLQQTPLELRRHPSAAPSPVLRWLLEKEEESKKAGGVSSSVTVAPSVESSTPAVNTAAHSAEAKVPSSAVPAAASVLARRGVGYKDPLLQRLMKKQQRQARDAAAAASSSALASSANGEAKAGGAVAASHWTRHPFSAMTATSWRVFRQQLGITVELVAPPPHAMQASSGSATTAVLADASRAESSASVRTTTNTTAAATTATTMPPADTLAAIRCWEEAQLPYALGRCVAQTYALPTAVQAQCVPLALLPSPSSQSETAREASTPSTQSSAMPRNLLTGASSSSSFSSLGVDVLAVAETGSGKTAAYLVPLLLHVLCRAPKLLGHPDRISLGPLSLVVVPTRELAEQVTASLLQLCGQQQQQLPSSSAAKSTGGGGVTAGAASRALQLSDIIAWEAEEGAAATSPAAAERNWLSEFRVVKVVGGESREAQYDALASGAHCVVGTVGQLHTLLEDRLLSLGNTHFVVMDEADRMLDEQQEARLVGVLERCPARRQTLMFTATLSAACARVAKRYLATCGYYVVRTPYRCASIRQSFELLSSASAAEMEKRETDGQPRPPPRQQRRMERDGVLADKDGGATAQQQQQQQRRLSPLIHPQKFSRLVAWLVYGTGPIIVFANEKVTCDALFEELRCEAEHLDAQQEYFTIADLVGPPPDGLVFREGTASNSTGHHASVPSSPVRPNATPSLRNLTSVAVVHSELSQSERRALVAQFQRRQRQVLITTDLLARGLDVAGVTLVVNYDVPWSAVSPADALTLYIHRIGRTGRAGSTGVAVTFISLPAAMVQRAEEVVKEGGDGVTSAKNTRPEKKSGADVKANDDDDPMSAMGELFDGDTNNIWAAGVAAAAEEKEEEEGGVVGASRRRLRRRGELDSSEDEGDTADGNGTRQGNNSGSDDDGGATTAGKGGRQAHGGRSGRKAKGGGVFASDVEVLRPLWTFLTECAEGEGCRDGAAALRRGSYAKISVPPALACIMAQLSATSQYGHITL